MCIQNRKMVETCLQHFWSKPRLHSSGCWEGPLPCYTCRRIDVNQLANNNDVVDQLSLDLLQNLDLPQNVLKEAKKGLAAWALKSYLNLFVLIFCSFCFVFPSVSFLLLCFMGFSRGLRPGSKVCSEHKNDWQYLSLGDLQQNKFFPKSKSLGFLVR